jgi:hypothetical protein
LRSARRDAFRCERPDEIRRAALSSPKPALVEAMVNDEKPTKPDELKV